MKKGLVALAMLLASAAAAQTLDPARSELSFGFRQENVPGSGKFRRFDAKVAFDPAKPEALRASVDIDVTSVDLGDPGWNSDIQGASWFDTKRHPKASFVATGAKSLGGGRYEAPAKLTLKGITRDVTATFVAKPGAGGMLLEGAVPLKRVEFKIGEGAWSDTSVVANEVAVRFRLVLKQP